MSGWQESDGSLGSQRVGPVCTFAQKPSEIEADGTTRALQCWLQKLEYGQMQVKQLTKDQLASSLRTQKAITNMEKRQDYKQAEPQDFLRHWRQSRKEERGLLLASAMSKHLNAGVCCLPSCLLWMGSLCVAKRAMRIWEAEAPREQAAQASAPASQVECELGEFTVEEWQAWLDGQKRLQAGSAAPSQPDQTASSSSGAAVSNGH